MNSSEYSLRAKENKYGLKHGLIFMGKANIAAYLWPMELFIRSNDLFIAKKNNFDLFAAKDPFNKRRENAKIL